MASGSNNTTKTTAAYASLDPGRKSFMQKKEMAKLENVMNARLRANVHDIDDDDEEECEEVAVTGTGKVDDLINEQLTKYQNTEGVFGLLAAIRQREDLSWRDVSEASGAHEPFYTTRSSMAGTGRGDDEAGPSRKDKGKRVLYDEDEIEEDIELTDVEEDDRVPGYDE
ncbi:hypothetical protein E3N88_03526 [Mikania micrantha]|uniref:Uncharacterized protein n=1 Tax=Mikania micrantha TaxID=192012 RepID=A0A5N6Q9P6_9ASTR|nr:hypothetical protein E3N88_03526 [Mikania micrantha]